MEVFFKGSPMQTSGTLPSIGTPAPAFTLVKTDLNELSLQQFTGKNVLLNIFVSVDTATCANSARKFNETVAKLNNAVVLCISNDLPFAQQRFCAAEGLSQVIPVSAFRNADFGRNYGVTLINGPLTGLLSRAIVIIDANQRIIYTEQVTEISQEPNYQAALNILGKLK